MIRCQTKLRWASGPKYFSLVLSPLSKAVTFRFFNQKGPWRQHLLRWAGGEQMHPAMFRELMGYATALVSMQRLEGRHSVLKRVLAWKHCQLPSTLSAAMRRRQNGDLQNPLFQANIHEYLAGIGNLHQGEWQSKTELLESLARSSARAVHDPLTSLRAQKDRFVEELAKVGGRNEQQAISREDLQLQREHLRASMVKGGFYAVPGLQCGSCKWALFRMLHLAPGGNVYLQKACHLAADDPST